MKLPKWLPSMGKNPSEPITANANLRVIGDMGSGKTAYMASLAYLTQCPNPNLDSPIESVTSLGDLASSRELLKFAQEILEQGLELEATKKGTDISQVRDYALMITLKSQFSWKISQLGSRPIELNINCRDYSGEFFDDLSSGVNDPYLEEYIEDCKLATGILLLVDGTSHRKDSIYAQGLENFFKELDQQGISSEERRIAFTLSKCELPQLWVNRHDPQGLITRRFPLTKRRLEIWADHPNRHLDYFTVSAFGTLGTNYPEANTTILKRDRGGTACVIRKPKFWRPFGLVSPIYWLCTGQRHKTLDED